MRGSAFIAWWISTLLAGLFVHVPILGLLVFLLVPASLVAWTACFRMLEPAEGTDGPRAASIGTKIAWVLTARGGLLLTGTVLIIASVVGDELLALQRSNFYIGPTGPRSLTGLQLLEPLLSRMGLELVGWMALWLAEIALVCYAVRLGAGWGTPKLLLLGAAPFPVPLLILFLILLYDLPLTA